MRPALIVNNAGKNYARFGSEWRRFARWFGFPSRPEQERWVLRNVSFRVDRGESVAIIGQNGAGKSTLLKMITGTSKPNQGSIHVSGRVSALLELGLGFDPELSGRDNVVHVAGMQGVHPHQLAELMPEIEAFAEIGEYFDQPVRTYSSGMQMRVAFSVATAIRPDILIVDEALAVGDSYFVHKSFQRIKQFRDAGTTLLFVSHDPSAVRTLCDRAVLLDAGRMVMEGPPSEVLDIYNGMIADKGTSTVNTVRKVTGNTQVVSGTREAEIIAVELVDANGLPLEIAQVAQPVRLRATARANTSLETLVFGYMIRDRVGEPVFGTNTHHTDQVVSRIDAGERLVFEVDFDLALGPGSYSVSVALHADETHVTRNFQWQDLALVFNVVNLDKPNFVGCAWIPSRILVSRAKSVEHAVQVGL